MTIEELNKKMKLGLPGGIYFFYGPETYLMEKKLAAIQKSIIAPGMEEFNRFVFEGKKISLEAVLEAVDQFPQMSEKKMVLVKNSGFFNNAATREYKRLKKVIPELPNDTCLIFTEDQFDKKKEKNLNIVEQKGGVVFFDYMPVSRVEVWLEERFGKAEKRILTRDVSYMVRLCGQSLGKIGKEYDKVINYVGRRDKITRADIDAVVDKTVEYRVYDMLDNITEGRGGKAREQMKFLQDTREQPTVILGIMVGKLADLLMCKLLREDGLPPQEIAEYFDFKRPMFAVNKTISESKRYGERYLKRMIDKGLKYDLDIKNGRLDGWTAAEMYLAELTKKTEE